MSGEWQTKFSISPGPGLLSRSRSGPDWELTWTEPGPDLGPGIGPGIGPGMGLGMGPGMGPGPELDNKFYLYPLVLAISEFKHCSFEKSVFVPLKCRRDPPHFFEGIFFSTYKII